MTPPEPPTAVTPPAPSRAVEPGPSDPKPSAFAPPQPPAPVAPPPLGAGSAAVGGTKPLPSERPEVAVAAAFAGGLLLALILRRLAR